MFLLDYDKEVEKKLVSKKVLEWGWDIRDVINKCNLPYIMSTRVLLDYDKQHKVGMPVELWNRSFFMGWSKDDYGQYVAKRKVQVNAD